MTPYCFKYQMTSEIFHNFYQQSSNKYFCLSFWVWSIFQVYISNSHNNKAKWINKNTTLWYFCTILTFLLFRNQKSSNYIKNFSQIKNLWYFNFQLWSKHIMSRNHTHYWWINICQQKIQYLVHTAITHFLSKIIAKFLEVY